MKEHKEWVIALVVIGMLLSAREVRRRYRRKRVNDVLGAATVVDVRTATEFVAGHYPGAVNIPLDRIEGAALVLADKGKPVIAYCLSGARSSVAARTLRRMGFSVVIDGGGLSDMPSPKDR